MSFPFIIFASGYSAYLSGEVAESLALFKQAYKDAIACEDWRCMLAAGVSVTRLQYVVGELEESFDFCEHFQKTTQALNKEPGQMKDWASGIFSNVYRERNQLREADESIQPLLASLPHCQEEWQPVTILTYYFEILVAQRRYSDAWSVLEKLEHYAELPHFSHYTGLRTYDGLRASLGLSSGDISWTIGWVQRTQAMYLDNVSHEFRFERLLIQRVLIGMGQTNQALNSILLERAALEPENKIYRIQNSLVEAICHNEEGDDDKAKRAFEVALRLAEKGGYRRAVLSWGKDMESLLREQESEFAQGLLKELKYGENTKPSPPCVLDREIDRLTKREAEVLTLIAQGLSNRDIAISIHISEGTVKTHCHKIFNKLNVKRRSEAVAQATAMGFFSQKCC